MAADQRIHDLRSVPLFADCSMRELGTLSRWLDEVDLKPGDVLTVEGRTGHEVFVIGEGEAIVTIGSKPVAWLGAGDVVGEMAVIEQEPRVATVTCASDVRAYVMTAQAFAAVLDQCPTVARHVLATVAHRLRQIQAA